MPKSALFFGISLACLLMVPGMVGEAEAQSAPSIDTSNPVELIIPLTKIHDDPGYSNDPAVVFDGSTVHVAWIDETSPQKIYYKKSTNGGSTFGSIVEVGSSNTAQGPRMAAVGNDVHIVWNDGAPHAKYARSTDGGSTFTTVDLFSDACASGQSCEIRWPDIAIYNNKIYIVGVAAYYPSYPNWSVIFQKSVDGGQSFDSFQSLYVTECCPLTRISAPAPNEVHIVTNGLQNDSYPIKYFKSTDGGNSFSDKGTIQYGRLNTHALTTDGSNVVIAVTDSGWSDWKIMRSTNNGDSFSSMTTVNNSCQVHPKVAIGGGTTYLLWNSCNSSAYFTTSSDNGATFGTVYEILDDVNQNDYSISASGSDLVIAFAHLGDIHVVVSSDNGQSFVGGTSALDTTPPTIYIWPGNWELNTYSGTGGMEVWYPIISPGNESIILSNAAGTDDLWSGIKISNPADRNDSNATLSCDPPPSSTFPVGTTTVTCTATDAAGNSATDTFTIKINEISQPTDSECREIVQNVFGDPSWDPEAAYTTYHCDTGIISSTVDVPLGYRFGSTALYYEQGWQGEWSAFNQNGTRVGSAGGNSNSLPSAWGGIGTYTIKNIWDPSVVTTVNVVTPPDKGISFSNIAVSFSGSTHTMTGTITNNNNYPVSDIKIYTHITDSADQYLTSRHDTFTESLSPGESKPLSITACCQSSGTFTPYVIALTVPADNTAPVISVPSNQVLSTTQSTSAFTYSTNSTDNIGVVGGVSCTHPSGSSFPVGTTTVTCTASDAAGNTATASFTVTVNQVALDLIPPVFTVFPSDITTRQVADACEFDGFTYDEWYANHPGYVYCEGTPGTQTSVDVQVIVRASDNVALVYDNIDDEAEGITGYSSSGVYDATTCTLDDGTDIRNQIDQKFDYSYDLGTHTVTCTASDTSGNTVTDSFTVTVGSESTTVNFTSGSSSPGCEDTLSCFSPYNANINTGETVKWQNNDSAAHTTTSGTPGGGSSGHWDSSLIMVGGSYEHTFTESGTYDYYCMVHPWTLGKIIVDGDSTVKTGGIVNDSTFYIDSIELKPEIKYDEDGNPIPPESYIEAIIEYDLIAHPGQGPLSWEGEYFPEGVYYFDVTLTNPHGSSQTHSHVTSGLNSMSSAHLSGPLFDQDTPINIDEGLTVDRHWNLGHFSGVWTIQLCLEGTDDCAEENFTLPSCSPGTLSACPETVFSTSAVVNPVITLPPSNHHYVNPTSLATSAPGHQGYDPNLLPDIMVASVGVTPGWNYNHDSSGWSDFAYWPNAVYDFVLSVDGDYEDANGKIAPTCLINNSIATNLQFDTANAVRQWDYRTFQYWSYYPAGVSTVQCTLTDPAGSGTGTLDFTFTVNPPAGDTTPPVTVTVPPNQVLTTTNSSRAFTYAFSPISSLGPASTSNGIVCEYVPQSNTGLSPDTSFIDRYGVHGNYYYPDGESFYEKHGDYFGQEWESPYHDWNYDFTTSYTHSKTFPEGTTKVTCGSVVTDPCSIPNLSICSQPDNWAARSLWINSVDNGGLGNYYDIPVSSLNGTATFDVTVIFDDGSLNIYNPSVTVTVPSDQVFTTTNSSHAVTYGFSATSSLGPASASNGIVCDYVPQSNTGLSLGQYNQYYYPDGEGFYEKHGTTFGQEFESDWRGEHYIWLNQNLGVELPGEMEDDMTHARTFPEGTTKVTCGSVVTDPSRSSSWAAHSLWINSVDNGGLGNYYDIPVSSLNGTATFDVTVIFDDGTTPITANIVENAQGSSTPGCDTTNECFMPYTASIEVGESIEFVNNDTAAHTSTSGTSTSGPSGHWDSSLIMPGMSYMIPANSLEQGTYHYFCMVHPWMEGVVQVGNGIPLRTSEPFEEIIDITPPTILTSSTITLSSTNSTGIIVNYEPASATDNKEISSIPYCYPHSGSLFPVGNSKVMCTVTDAAGNSAAKTFEINVIDVSASGDVTPPTITQPNVISVDATTANGAVVKYASPVATDNMEVAYGPICTPKSGSFFPLGDTTVTCIAKDAKGNQGSVAFLVKVNSKIVAPVEIKTSVSVNVGKEKYQNNEALFVTGSVNPVTGDPLILEVQDELGDTLAIQQAKVEEFGSYTAIIFPSSLWDSDGEYSIFASYGESKSLGSFDFAVVSIEEAPPIESVPTQLNIKQYFPGVFDAGETIEISADMDSGSGHSIVLSVDGPDAQLLLQPLNTDDSGTVNLSFGLADDLSTGTYTITAKSSGTGYDLEDTLNIVVIAPIPDLTVKNVKATTEDGSNASKYDAGELAYFATNLTTETDTPVLVTVNVFDSQGNTLGVGFFKSTIGKGDSEIVLGFELPEDVVSGVAEVYTNVFTDWPDQGGVPVTDEIKASVEIIGVAPEPVVEEVEPVVEEVEPVVEEVEPVVEEVEPVVEEIEVETSAVTITVPSNQVFTTTNSSGAFTYAFSPTSSLGPVSASNGIVCEYVPQSNTGLSPDTSFIDRYGVHGNYYYPDGESFYEKHGDYFGQEWESNYKDPTHSRTFPEGTTKVTCGSVVTDPSRSSSWAAQSLWINSVDNGGLGNYYDIPVSSLNGTATFDVTVIFDDVTQATQSVTVQHVQGSAIPGCEPNCFNPSNAQVNLGGTVIWENIDSAPHTTTSGTPTNGPDGIIDSGLMMPDQSFSHTFDDLGVYDYFCIVHPWMQGKITVIGGN